MRDGKHLYCRWTQPYVHTFDSADFTINYTMGKRTFDLGNGDWYLQLAYGTARAGRYKSYSLA